MQSEGFMGLGKKNLAILTVAGHSLAYLINKGNGKLYGWLYHPPKETMEQSLAGKTYHIIKTSENNVQAKKFAAAVEAAYADLTVRTTAEERKRSREFQKLKKQPF